MWGPRGSQAHIWGLRVESVGSRVLGLGLGFRFGGCQVSSKGCSLSQLRETASLGFPWCEGYTGQEIGPAEVP